MPGRLLYTLSVEARAIKSTRSSAKLVHPYAFVEGVPTTNNHAERELRAFVLWRKQTAGTRSERGDRYAERVMTVVHTLRKQDRHVLSYLEDACIAALRGAPTPALILHDP